MIYLNTNLIFNRGLKMIKKWTEYKLLLEALKYETRGKFQKYSNGAYQTAKKRGILNEICVHMPKKVNAKGSFIKWNYEKIQQEALKYTYRSEFCKYSNVAYQMALKRSILNTVCSHMPIHKRKRLKKKKWNKVTIRAEAIKYVNRTEFQKKNKMAYEIARIRGYLDEVCSRMKNPKNSSNNERFLFNKIKELYPSVITLRDRKANITNKPHIKGFDIDIFIPELNKGIEFDGYRYHSFEFMKKSKKHWPEEDICNYHQIKDDYFLSKGIKLLHITDLEWLNDKEQSLSKILKFLEN